MKKGKGGTGPKVALQLYVTGWTPQSDAALRNVKVFFKTLGKPYTIEVVDLLHDPDVAEKERVIATPMLVKRSPLPMRRIVGDLSERSELLAGLGLEDAHAR